MGNFAARRRGVTCPFEETWLWRSSPSFCTTTGIAPVSGAFQQCLQGRKKISEEASIVASLSAIRPVRVGAGYITRSASPLERDKHTQAFAHMFPTRLRYGYSFATATHGSLSFALYHNKTSMPKSKKKSCTFYSSKKHVMRVHKTRNARIINARIVARKSCQT